MLRIKPKPILALPWPAVWLLAAAAGLAPVPVSAASPETGGPGFFENRIRPVLAEYCYQCHSAAAKKIGGGLKLDTKEDFLKGGIDGPVVVPGDPGASLLVRAVRYDDPERQMPPQKSGGRKLPDAVIADLSRWVEMGAPYPETPAADQPAAKPPWSLAPVMDPAPPPVKDPAWAATSIDPFILARIGAQGLTPAPKADPLTLIRRVTFDLTGLPPTPEEIDAFAADAGPDAFAKVVDRLLASPHYGGHWGRHWLDVVRYADTAGDTADYPLPEAWRYRNYVIDAFNADKPYDVFLREQIAGDILARQGPPQRYAEQVTATGYLALSRRFGFDSENYHHLTIQDTIDTLGQSVLGLTVGCARCHDHKFDPVSMQDYYGLFGIFESTRYAFPGSEQKGRYRAMVPLVPVAESQQKMQALQSRFAALGMAPGAVLRSLDDCDGDFEMQHIASGGSNGVLVPPWFYGGKVSVTLAAQSPFKHLHPFGIVGASIAPGAGEYFVRQTLHPARTRGVVHVNLEFRAAANLPAARGRHRFLVGAQGRLPAVEAFLSADSLTFPGGPGPLVIPLTKPGDWHCLQLAIDLDSRSFTGSVGLPGNITGFAARPLAVASDGGVNFLTIDSTASGDGPLPGLEVDNIGVQEAPVPPASATPAGVPAAPPLLAGLNAELLEVAGMDGDLEAQENGTVPSANWHPGPNSGVRISAASQSPFLNLYPAGTQGVHLPATPDGAYNGFGNRLPKQWNSGSTARLHVSFDFRCGTAAEAGTGTWRFQIGHTPATAAVQLGFNSTEILRRTGEAHAPAASLLPGEWHQVQMVMDLQARTFTGSVAARAVCTAFSGNFAAAWDGSIDYLFIDSSGHLPGPKPSMDTDNFMISEAPLPPLEAPAAPFAGAPPPGRQAKIKELRRKIAERTAVEDQQRRELEGQLAAGPVALAYGVSEGTPHAARLQIRGEPDKPGAEVPRGFIQVLGHAGLPAATTGSGRLELAQWLTRPDNPLTARVMVNRLWQYHFGRGLVRTPNDFGSRSEPPTHPELLDHLATQFVRSGWSLKAMHRLILLSATWQQSAITDAAGPGAAEAYAAFSRRRLGAEEIRDTILSVSGALDPGPGMGHPFPPAHTWGYSQHGPFSAVYEHDKRSVYLMVQRIKRHPFLALFDGADPNSSTAGRRITTVPTQALYFLNDPFVHAMAGKFAERLQAASSDEPKQIELATRLALGRLPTDAERREAADFLAAYRAELGASGTANPAGPALAAYVRTLFGSNEFIHCD